MAEDWEVSNSDDDDDTSYTPSPELIISLYNQINEGKIPELEAVILPRREPEVQKTESSSVEMDNNEENVEADKESSPKSSEPNEFDFDSQAVDTVKRFTPRRTPSRPQTKKVARMDKVCSNIIKYQKMDAELEQQISEPS